MKMTAPQTILLLSTLFISVTFAYGPCSIQAVDYKSGTPYCHVDIDNEESQVFIAVSNTSFCGGVTHIPIGYVTAKIKVNCQQTVTPLFLSSADSCAGGPELSQYEFVSIPEGFCTPDPNPHDPDDPRDPANPPNANVVSSMYKYLFFGIVGLDVVALIFFTSIGNDEDEPQFSPEFRAKVLEQGSEHFTSRSGMPLLGHIEVGPVSSKTRIAIVCLLCLVIAGFHVPLASDIGGLPLISALAWAFAAMIGILVFMGNNLYDTWHISTTVATTFSLLCDGLALSFFISTASSAVGACRTACDAAYDPEGDLDEKLYELCMDACGSVFPIIIMPIVSSVLLLIGMVAVVFETHRAKKGNGELMNIKAIPSQTTDELDGNAPTDEVAVITAVNNGDGIDAHVVNTVSEVAAAETGDQNAPVSVGTGESTQFYPDA